ncbi:hypothetical protein ACLOJK_036985 [Asimina triloba]
MIAGSLADAGSSRCRPILLEWATPRLIVAEQGYWDVDLGGVLVAALCLWKDAAGVAASVAQNANPTAAVHLVGGGLIMEDLKMM